MSYSDNNYGNSSQFPVTDTNMFVNMLANSDKLVSESKRWQYDGEKNPELDDDHSNYINNANISEHHTDNNEKEKEKERNNSEHYTDNRSDVKNTEKQESNSNTNKDTNKDDDANLSPEELMLRKLDMLRKLSELAQAGVKLSQNYNMNSDYKMMKYEYELHKGIRAKQNGVNWMSSMSLNMIYGLEMLNDKYNPFDLKLKGWSEQMNADINNYYDVFGELYEKYNQPGKNMAPELKLLLMVSGSALKFHLTNTMMGNLPTLNSQLDEDPVLAEQLRQKAIQQKIKEQNQKNNEALKTSMNKEHEQATQKASDLNLIRQKEIEYQNLKRENAQKNAELEALREKLLISQTQKNTQSNTGPNRNIQQTNPMPSTIQRQAPQPVNMQQFNPENQQPIRMSPYVQKMMLAKQQQQQQFQEQLVQQYGLSNNSGVSNKLTNLQAQANYMEELEKIKSLREKEEERVRLEKLKTNSKSSKKSDTSESTESSSEVSSEIHKSETSTSTSASSSASSKSSKSNVEYNVNLKTILSDTKKNLKDTNSSDKILDLGTVDADEISRSNISLGKKRVKKDKESKDSKDTKDTNKSDKPKTVRQKKTGINF